MELYYHSVDKDVLILSADGGLDSQSAEELVTDLGRLVEAGARKLIVDCSRLGYINSYGISVLVRLHKKLATRGGDVKLAALDTFVTRLIHTTGLDLVFQIYPNLDEARRAFASAEKGSSL